MKTTTALGLTFGVIVLAIAALFFEAALLGLILSWFSISLTFWQNFAIILLANLILKPSGGSSK